MDIPVISESVSPVLYPALASFFVYSFFGWCLEVLFAAFRTGTFVNRGFLNGPVCPIYGIGMVLICQISAFAGGGAGTIFITGMVLASALELVAGFVLKCFFRTRWWDYSDMPLNIGGYICLEYSLLWGAAAVFAVKIIDTGVSKVLGLLEPEVGMVALLPLILLLLADFTATLSQLLKIPRRLRMLESVEKSLSSVPERLGEEILVEGLERTKRTSNAVLQSVPGLEQVQENARETVLSFRNGMERTAMEQQSAAKAELESLRRELRNQLRVILMEHPVGKRILHAFPDLTRNHVLRSLTDRDGPEGKQNK